MYYSERIMATDYFFSELFTGEDTMKGSFEWGTLFPLSSVFWPHASVPLWGGHDSHKQRDYWIWPLIFAVWHRPESLFDTLLPWELDHLFCIPRVARFLRKVTR